MARSDAADAILGKYFRVLDHGFVSLVDYMGTDMDVVSAARVSYGAGTKGYKDDRGLLRYMLRGKHTSPFEQVELKFHVKLPIFVARQLIRHRTANINEYSMRYSLPFMQFYMPEPVNMGTQSKKNKQGRAEPVTEFQADAIQMKWRLLQQESIELYEMLTSSSIDLARELARIGLPLSIYTEWYWKIDLHNLMHFLCLRSDGHAQWEIQQFSNMKASMMRTVAPMTYDAWIDYKFQAHTFSRMEMVMLREYLNSPVPTEFSQERATELGMTAREWEEFGDAVLNMRSPNRFEIPANFRINGEDAVPAEQLLQEALMSAPKEL